jgi:energy-coupling factor transport system permease protein
MIAGRQAGTLRLPRTLHPGAWWIWALGMATAASRTTNPLLLAVIIAVVAVVVSARRGDAPWSTGFRAYLVMGAIVIVTRLVFRLLLDGQYGAHVLFTLPRIPLPDAVAGIKLGGAVSAEGLLAAFYDGLRLATLIVCIGAANVLADPKRLLKSLPGALRELGVAITVALTCAPQLVESGRRVRRAQRLRGEPRRRRHLVKQVLIPVLTDALDRSVTLAAAMDSRGFGRRAAVATHRRVATGGLLLAGVAGVCVGTYGLLDATTPRWLGLPMLLAGVAAAAGGLALGSREVHHTTYRPDPWRFPEWAVAGSGVVVAAVLFAAASIAPDALNPSLQPLTWPSLPLVPLLGILVGLLPAVIAPPVARMDASATNAWAGPSSRGGSASARVEGAAGDAAAEPATPVSVDA